MGSDQFGKGWDLGSGYGEASAQKVIERQVELHASFCQSEHDVARITTFEADGSAGDFPFGDEGADVVFGSV
ncbi:MAG TPA: hypothetical protein VKP67_14665, partial [Xanthobacteraceae bacterium]|nr:hypothetical protein [Xanthobacteraceae bacterium]